jgi:hypothetical protein
MTLIIDRDDKIGSVLREMQSNLGTAATFTAGEFYASYVQQYPGDVQMMEDRKLVKPSRPTLEGHLNGELPIYAKKTDGSDPDRPAIEQLGVKKYRFLSNLISANGFPKEDAPFSSRSSGDYLPHKDDFECAYRMICSYGDKIPIDSVLDQIEKNAINTGHNLKINWRLNTERNIELWKKR